MKLIQPLMECKHNLLYVKTSPTFHNPFEKKSHRTTWWECWVRSFLDVCHHGYCSSLSSSLLFQEEMFYEQVGLLPLRTASCLRIALPSLSIQSQVLCNILVETENASTLLTCKHPLAFWQGSTNINTVIMSGNRESVNLTYLQASISFLTRVNRHKHSHHVRKQAAVLVPVAATCMIWDTE